MKKKKKEEAEKRKSDLLKQAVSKRLAEAEKAKGDGAAGKAPTTDARKDDDEVKDNKDGGDTTKDSDEVGVFVQSKNK